MSFFDVFWSWFKTFILPIFTNKESKQKFVAKIQDSYWLLVWGERDKNIYQNYDLFSCGIDVWSKKKEEIILYTYFHGGDKSLCPCMFGRPCYSLGSYDNLTLNFKLESFSGSSPQEELWRFGSFYIKHAPHDLFSTTWCSTTMAQWG